MSLFSKIKTGPTVAALRVFLYGQEGVGKTTWAANCPNALFLSCEDGGGDLEYARLECPTWRSLLEALEEILKDGPGEYQTIVIDTINGYERLLWESICRKAQVDTIEEVGGGYGKGYTRALEEMGTLQVVLDALRSKHKLHVILLGHSHVRPFNDPLGNPYDRYEVRMHQKAAALWAACADCVLFAGYDVTVKTTKRNAQLTEKGKAISGRRVVFTNKDPAYDAKNRFALPDEMPLEWPAFAKAIGWDRRTVTLRGPASEATRPTKPQTQEASGEDCYTASMLLLDAAQTRLGRIYNQQDCERILLGAQTAWKEREALTITQVWLKMKDRSDSALAQLLDAVAKKLDPQPVWTPVPTGK